MLILMPAQLLRGFKMSINDLSSDRKRILRVCDEFGLSTVAGLTILEAVDSYQNYDNLPCAIKNDMQVICDMFNVNLSFSFLKRGKIALTGIWTELRSTYLYTEESLADRDLKRHWPKNNPKDMHLRIGANHILSEV